MIFCFKYKTIASKRSPWQHHGVNADMRYTRAKLEKVLLITSKDIHQFMKCIIREEITSRDTKLNLDILKTQISRKRNKIVRN